VLRVGKLLGAERVIFGEHTVSSNVVSRHAFVFPYGGAGRSETVYDVSVSVRNVDVETGEIKWSGSAHFSSPITNPETAIGLLTQAAVSRASCRIESGYEWKEANAYEKWGCLKKE